MANYPTSLDSDANLYVAVNSLATSIVGALTSSGGNNGANIEVTSTAGFPATGFITVDSEAISYTSILSAPARFSGITRGADGTTAASHSAGATAKHNIIAAHHNTLKDAIIAIETALGTALANVVQTTLAQTIAGIKSFTSSIRASDGTAGAPAYAFINGTNTGIYLVSGTIGIVIAGNVVAQFTPSNGFNFLGTTTNDNAAAGNVGQYIESVVGNVNAFGSNTFGDITSISLPAGDWDVSAVTNGDTTTATVTYFSMGISTTSGNSGTGLVDGDTRVYAGQSTNFATTAIWGLAIPVKRFSLSATTTVYLKGHAIYSAGTPFFLGARLSARRVR